jgi:hypothetical protein
MNLGATVRTVTDEACPNRLGRTRDGCRCHPCRDGQGRALTDGLFEVVPGIYQLRGFDLSVMSVVEGDTGVIVVDPLISPAAGDRSVRPLRGAPGGTGRSGP